MHIAQFIHRYPPALGGAEAYAARLSRFLVAAGHRVSVWTTTADHLGAFQRTGLAEFPRGTERIDGVDVHRFALNWRFPGRRWALKLASLVPHRIVQTQVAGWMPISWDMRRAVDDVGERPDIVHFLAFPYSFIGRQAWRLAHRFGLPTVVTPFLHLGDLDRPTNRVRRGYTRPPLRWLLRQADAILAQTEVERQAIIDLGVPPERVVQQGLGVDPADCTGGNRQRARLAWGIQTDEVVVGHLANLSTEKGSVDLLQALKHCQQAVKLVLAGPAMPSFERAWQSRPWDRVRRLGPLNDLDRRDFFAGIDLFALPSTSDSFGLVLLESWANGAPVVGYRAGGIAAVIRHDIDGLVTPCHDLRALAHAIDRLAGDPGCRQQFGEAGRHRVLADYRWPDRLRIALDTLTGACRP